MVDFAASSGASSAKLRMSMEYTPKCGVLGMAMGALMMRREFTSVLDGVLAGLDQHRTTGETIGPEFRPRRAA